ncbi:MAG: hypothetical protein JWN67_1955 [Actinomycetia bacterium]|nr:hypothetical protein [Actinomycetes bacterium]
MDEGRTPVSLGDRLDVVALVAASAGAIVVAANVVAALLVDIGSGAAPSPVRERIILATQPANVALGVVVLVAASALAVRRWLTGDHPAPVDALGTLVAGTAGTVAVLAVIGMFAQVLWELEGASWGWRVASIGNHTAAAALGAVACWLVRPTGPQRSR